MWPDLAEFGVTPLNFQSYTTAEIQGFLDRLEHRNRAARQQAQRARRRGR